MLRVRDWLIGAHLWLYGVLHRAELERLDAESEALEEDPECQAFVRELEDSWPPPIPEFDPRRTAVFTAAGKRSAMRWYNLFYYRLHIRRDAFWLLEHGYHSLVVDYGSRYGMLALEELVRLREQGAAFRLYCGKVFGERWRLSTKREGWKELCLVFSCDHNFGMHDPETFRRGVYRRVSAFSLERYFLLSKQWIPPWLFESWERAK